MCGIIGVAFQHPCLGAVGSLPGGRSCATQAQMVKVARASMLNSLEVRPDAGLPFDRVRLRKVALVS